MSAGRMIENTQWKWCYRSLLSAVIFAIICISAFEFIDGTSGGYAIAFVSFTLAITGVAVAALFYSRAHVMDSIMSNAHPLAYWIYSSEEAVYPFQSFLMRMRGVTFKNRTGIGPNMLIFSFSQLVGLYITSQFEIGVPVPEGEEETACKIADMLGSP